MLHHQVEGLSAAFVARPAPRRPMAVDLLARVSVHLAVRRLIIETSRKSDAIANAAKLHRPRRGLSAVVASPARRGRQELTRCANFGAGGTRCD